MTPSGMTPSGMTPPVIGLAGGIGSGKSTVADILERLGCVVSRSDREGRAALRDPEIRDTLVVWWGPSMLDGDGAIDRQRVAEIVFSDRAERDRLEKLTHPWIEARRRDLFAAASPDAPAFVIDAPLLFEAGVNEECDAVIFVEAGRDERIRRVRTDRGWTEREARRREDSQLPLDVKRSGADYVIRNDGDLSALETQVRTVLETIIETRRT